MIPSFTPATTMRPTLTRLALCAAMTAAFWFGLTDSLGQMTHHSCQAGSIRACKQLQQGGHS
jgi:hypothetical protein